jgi:hypothetical protein
MQLSPPKGTMGYISEVATGRRQVRGFAELFAGRYGLETAFIPWFGAASQYRRVSIFALSIPQASSKPKTEREFDSMAEVTAYAAQKRTKRTLR